MTVPGPAGAGAVRRLRGLRRIAATAWHLGRGLATVAWRWRRLDEPARQARIAAWSRGLLAAMGVRLIVRGQPRPGPTLLVANHVSWLDVAALHAIVPQARFVAQAGIRRWPVLGWLIASVGTLFIERERKRDALRVVHTIAFELAAGGTAAVFPEGTTGSGRELLPFHANLLQAAISTDTPVQAVALRYREPPAPFSAAVQWTDERTLLGSVWAIACASGVEVVVEVLPARGTRHADRRALAQTLREEIAAVLDEAPPARA